MSLILTGSISLDSTFKAFIVTVKLFYSDNVCLDLILSLLKKFDSERGTPPPPTYKRSKQNRRPTLREKQLTHRDFAMKS
jgi:hypothetical protein